MKLTITTELKRKTHSPSGERGKTLCGKRQGPTVPSTSERPTCMVCAVVYDQAARGIVREMNIEQKEIRDRRFDFGFALSLILLVRSFPKLSQEAFEILQEAGYEMNDFEKIDFDETDRIILNQIFGV